VKIKWNLENKMDVLEDFRDASNGDSVQNKNRWIWMSHRIFKRCPKMRILAQKIFWKDGSSIVCFAARNIRMLASQILKEGIALGET